MRSFHVILLMLASLGSAAVGQPARPQIVMLGDNERVVHIAGSAFTHSYYEPRLESLLLQIGGARGLVYRKVACGTMDSLGRDLDAQVLAYQPTLVILQAGIEDLSRQYRRATYDFSAYPKALEEVVRRLRAANARVVLCSVTPVGNGSTKEKLVHPNDGLKTWVDAAREIAAKHGAAFADLFTGALEWGMIGNDARTRYFYDPEGHAKSWKLFTDQVTFGPAGSTTEVNAATGEVKADGAKAADVKPTLDARSVAFTLSVERGGEPQTLKVSGLPAGDYDVIVADKVVLTRTAADLAQGVDLAAFIPLQGSSQEFKVESDKGNAAVAALAGIRTYQLPGWVKAPDFEQQKRVAIQSALDGLNTHDEAMRKLVLRKPVAVCIKPH